MDKKRCDIDCRYKWDLTKIYKTEEEVENDFKKVISKIDDFTSYKDNLVNDSSTLLKAINSYYEITRIYEKLVVYSNMKLHEDMGVSKNQVLVGRVEHLGDILSEKTSFFIPTLLKEDYSKIERFIKENKDLQKYEFMLKDVFRDKEHILSLKEEELLSQLGEIFNNPSNTYEMLDAVDISFKDLKVDREVLPLNQSNYSLYLKSDNRKIRKKAFDLYFDTYDKHKNTYASTLIGDLKTDSFIAKIRKYPSSLEMSLFDDNISINLYNKLIDCVNKNISINHKYILLKRQVLGLKNMHMYDIYAPLVKNIQRTYSYEEAIDIVINALKPLGSDYIEKLKKLINSNIIDVYHNKNKQTGAYSWGCYDSSPYVLLNFEGSFNDVSTIAHELGHAMHSVYSNSNNHYHDASYTIFIAEIASTVNEILLNRYCTEHAKTKEEKLFFINSLLENIRTTLIRQTMFAEFEKIIHEHLDNNEVLTEEKISNIYYDLNKKYYGKAIIHDEKIKLEWARISHFYNSFYVYKYATGISCSLKIASDILNKKPNSLENYLNLLKSGGKDYPEELLKKVSIDIENDDTIEKALMIYDNLIDEFKNIYNE